MLLHILFSLLCLSTGIIGSSSKRGEVTQSDQFNLKTLKDLQAKHRGGVIEFNADLLKKFSTVEHKKRDFHLFIIFTALDKESNCQYCPVAAEMLKATMNVFYKNAKKGPLPSFFASIDLKNNIEAFKMMGLQHVPVIYHFGPESMAPKSFENNNPNDKGALLRFVATQTGSQINEEDAFKPEKNHSALILTVSVVAILAGLMYVEFLTPAMVFKNFYIWSISIMSFIIVMLSGYMWVRIRNAPFIGQGTNGPSYIYASPQSQFGVESRIVSGLNAGTILVFLMITAVTYKFEDNNKRRIAAMIMSILYVAGHTALMKVFTQKMPMYSIPSIF